MIRKATEEDLSRIAEIFVFNNRINYFPIFKQEEYSFGELQVVSMIDHYFGKVEVLENLYVADECGIVKGFMEIHGTEIRKLYVDPCFQSGGIGKKLMEHAISTFDADHLWALEKNTRAIAFYHRHGFMENGEKELEEGTTEYIAKLIRVEENVQLDEKPMHRKIMSNSRIPAKPIASPVFFKYTNNAYLFSGFSSNAIVRFIRSFASSSVSVGCQSIYFALSLCLHRL